MDPLLLSPTAHQTPRPTRPLAPYHALFLALCRVTWRFPAGDPLELGPALRRAALDATEAMLAACSAHTADRVTALGQVDQRLREVAFLSEVVRRLGYLNEATAADVFALLDRARDTMPRTLSCRRSPQASPGPKHVAQPPTSRRRVRRVR